MHPKYATMLGYTQEELESNFEEEIVVTSALLSLSRTELIDKMRLWYNGYRFEENAETVYNPVSVYFSSLSKSLKIFRYLWYAYLLINILKKECLYDFSFTASNPTRI